MRAVTIRDQRLDNFDRRAFDTSSIEVGQDLQHIHIPCLQDLNR